ncbi:hypothetical protein D9757_013179 [Collybiopsis confluens]|uniref:Uncharacterized protein n=1 Tax=Collybiopsis confluens TaxID=2823264 RepID=A0A8H5D7I3_9AGAR|nr:hypothetical protein D9757_013179 [Collybiopsis confluens]
MDHAFYTLLTKATTPLETNSLSTNKILLDAANATPTRRMFIFVPPINAEFSLPSEISAHDQKNWKKFPTSPVMNLTDFFKTRRLKQAFRGLWIKERSPEDEGEDMERDRDEDS